MSGSNRDTTGGPGPGNGDTDCTRIMEKTILNSPVPEVVSTLKTGDILNVLLRERSLVAVTEDNVVAGALTPPILPKIVECISEGYEYIAIVQSITGGRCIVEIRLMRVDSIIEGMPAKENTGGYG